MNINREKIEKVLENVIEGLKTLPDIDYEDIMRKFTEVEFTSDQITTYSAIIVMALIPILLGSLKSLKIKKGMVESLTSKDAFLFPVIGSCVLFGLYLLFKVFKEEYLNTLLSAYFLGLGVYFVFITVSPILAFVFGSSKKKDKRFSIPMPSFIMDEPLYFDFVDILNFFCCIGLVSYYVYTKNWIANNVLGISFSMQAIAQISIGSYWVGCILLSGLFFYDIFWVFGTDVMVTVAKKFDAPVKLLFPKDLFADKLEYSMLGLGDIVIPGIFIALLMRYDRARSRRYNKGKRGGKRSGFFFPLYFIVTYIAYTIGLGVTIVVMHTFKAAQPALLYLVPACIGASFFTSISICDTFNLFSYTEEEKKDNDKKKKIKKKSD